MKNYSIKIISAILVALFITSSDVNAQGTFSGSLEMNTNFFLRDSTTNDTTQTVAIPPQTQNELTGGELWLNMNYNYKGYDLAMRFDALYNSNLPNPQRSYTAQGLGYWHIRKKIDKLDITVGHLYDQIGAGIIFRSYEARALFIDNALVGTRLQYDLLEKDNASLFVKAFMGRHKKPFQNNSDKILGKAYKPFVKGINLEGYWTDNEGKLSLAPGLGIVNRTLNEDAMNAIVSNVQLLSESDRFVPKYNVYATTLYNTLTAGDFTWYVEGAYKTEEAIINAKDSLVNKDGSVLYTSLAYSQKGFGVTVEAKRTENFVLKSLPTDPSLLNQEGAITFLPPMTRVNTYRLTSRYNAPTQFLGELAFQADVRYSPHRKLNFNLFGSYIDDLDGNALFREAHFNARYRKKKYAVVSGLQLLWYNQGTYEGKGNIPLVQTITPYVDFLYKITRKKSIRAELSYMYTKQDLGQWAFAQVEVGFAPNWIITASDMINVVPKKTNKIVHYPSLSVVYTRKANRFTLSFVRQVAGVVCTGGICRPEPAFSGVRFNVISSF